MIYANDINIGYGFDGVMYEGMEYGYSCESETKIPDLCEDQVAYIGDGNGNYWARNENENLLGGLDLLSHGADDNDNDILKPSLKTKNTSNNGTVTMYTSYSQWIFVGIVACFALNIFVCLYIKCLRRSKYNAGKGSKYGHIDESDDSDGTDSEIDSDESVGQLIE